MALTMQLALMPNISMSSADGPLLGKRVTHRCLTVMSFSPDSAAATASPRPPTNEKSKHNIRISSDHHKSARKVQLLQASPAFCRILSVPCILSHLSVPCTLSQKYQSVTYFQQIVHLQIYLVAYFVSSTSQMKHVVLGWRKIRFTNKMTCP